MPYKLALSYYHLEPYLFDVVGPRFQEEHSLEASDFFCIVIWKANRSKSKIAKRLLTRDPKTRKPLAKERKTLDPVVRDLTARIHGIKDAKSRLAYLVKDWGFRLPMATAILTVLYPEEFTVYDVRVCGQVGMLQDLTPIRDFERLWTSYLEFKKAVCAAAPEVLSLRDKDRYLWGKSFAEDLASGIKRAFGPKS